MGKAERRKGATGELEVAAVFREVGFDCDRTPNSGGLRIRGDLYGNVPAHVEVKRQEVARPWAWYEQARAEAPDDSLPIVAFRRSRSPWLAIVPLEALAAIMAAATVATQTAGSPPRCSLAGCDEPARPSSLCAFHDDELRSELGVRPFDPARDAA